MTRRPAHLTEHNAATFQLSGVVENYHLRTPYAPALADALRALMQPAGGAVIELGCGTGEIARMLAPHAARVDAFDISAPMLDRARTMPGGEHPAIRWTLAPAEDALLAGPYALAVAGDALHWMRWEAVLPRIAAALAPGAVLAIVHAASEDPPWSGELLEIIVRYSTIPDFERYVLAEELERRGLFRQIGEQQLDPLPFTRTVDDYIASLHSSSGLAAERMPAENVRAFDGAVRALVAPHVRDGVLHLTAAAQITWGTPLTPATENARR